MRASATLDQQMLSARRNLADRLSGKDRAARCPTRKTCPASDASRPPLAPVSIAPRGLIRQSPKKKEGAEHDPDGPPCGSLGQSKSSTPLSAPTDANVEEFQERSV